MHKYMVVSYKEDNADYCKGCLMASYNSDLKIEQFNSIDEIIEHMATIDTTPLECGEEGYEHDMFVAKMGGICTFYFDDESATKYQNKMQEKRAIREAAKKQEKDKKEEIQRQFQLEKDKREFARLTEKLNNM